MDLVLWVGRINANERLMVRVRNRTGTFGGVMYRSWPMVSLGPSFFCFRDGGVLGLFVDAPWS